ncbi:hypothetical protein LEMLEM_LOCUS16090 [Lemmus lemmus]
MPVVVLECGVRSWNAYERVKPERLHGSHPRRPQHMSFPELASEMHLQGKPLNLCEWQFKM